MTMQNMIGEFEKLGFKASKSYQSDTKKYRFVIEKDGFSVVGYFDYIQSDTHENRDNRQWAFIQDMNRTFHSLPHVDTSKSVTTTSQIFQSIIDDTNARRPVKIKVVHFSGPVTTVIWEDGTKSQVRCQEGDTFDPEKGLALAIAKKALGNKGSWYDDIKKWVDKYYVDTACTDFDNALKKMRDFTINCTFPVSSVTVDNFEFKLRPNGGAHVKYVGTQDSDEAKRVDENNKPARITKPLSNPHRCATCMYVNSPITHGPCSDCSWDYSNWKSADEPQKTHYDPIAEAYAIAVRIRDGLYDEDDTIESIIGFLGEALDK